jgi:hypothetical protein
MNDVKKIGTTHLGRAACIYLRQSTAAQVEHNRESTQRQSVSRDPDRRFAAVNYRIAKG